MDYCAWDARLEMPDEHGVPARAAIAFQARKGNPTAQARLVSPPFPEALRYLWVWHQELQRGTGYGMEGKTPLTWSTLDAWARVMGVVPTSEDASALLSLDVVSRNPAGWEAHRA